MSGIVSKLVKRRISCKKDFLNVAFSEELWWLKIWSIILNFNNVVLNSLIGFTFTDRRELMNSLNQLLWQSFQLNFCGLSPQTDTYKNAEFIFYMFRFSLAKKAITQIFRTNEFLTAAQGKQGQFWSHRCFLQWKMVQIVFSDWPFWKTFLNFFSSSLKKSFYSLN